MFLQANKADAVLVTFSFPALKLSAVNISEKKRKDND